MKSRSVNHEIAVSLVLFSPSARVALAEPDAVALRQKRLVEVVRTTSTSAGLRLTYEGKAPLQRVGLMAK
ncbi:exported hypothetical protein [Paraburkholderia piptadeniae]|uniref:Uncharacterized protein n=1 Tax=Paraburkholderia piptadeniae TaxID=1701573 RepID=A0A1N7S9I1_9BURK|nr:hypothetical protein [Paraburkholderia piptadeniae]SIT43981.1 exported hypothetical protein [Paraburkholderia piptadeniae]